MKSTIGISAVLAVAMLAAPSVRADHGVEDLYGTSYGQFGRTVEINVGSEYIDGANGGQARMMVGVEYLGYPVGVQANLLEMLLEGKVEVDLQYIGRIRADLGIGVGNGIAGGEGVDSYNVSVGIFAQDGMEIDPEDRTITVSQGQLGVVKFSRDTAMNEEMVFIVRILDSRARVIMGTQGDAAAFYVGAALRGLGYRHKDYVEGTSFNGFEFAGLGGELGVLFALSRKATLELGLGGDADVSFGGNNGFAVQTDSNAFGTARFTYRGDSMAFQISADGGYRYSYDSGHGSGTGAPFVGTRAALWF